MKEKINFFLARYFTSFINEIHDSSSFFKLSFLQKIVFIVLCFCEIFYSIFLKLYIFFARERGKKFPFKIISVGNISCGGTGKSVFVRFLVENFNYSWAVVMRGYRGENEKIGNSFLVSSGNHIFCEVAFCGDEAFMFANFLKVPIVVGRDRSKSCHLVSNFSLSETKRVECVVLDDAYQNYSTKKDFEILLLDARKPFENGHCLPAGKLREKDLTRADVIILTHADKILSSQLKSLKDEIKIKSQNILVLSGKHESSNFLDSDLNYISKNEFINNKVLIFAGIGSFSNFVKNIKDLLVEVVSALQYPDHYVYTIEDVANIIKLFENSSAEKIITTRKDWHKICSFISEFNKKKIWVYCLDVKFEFLSIEEQKYFSELLNKKINLN